MLRRFLSFFYFTLRVVVVYSLVFLESLLDVSEILKLNVVRRMFWGRGSFYKNSFHLVVILVTSGLLVTGILNRVGRVEGQSLEISYGASGNADLLFQGSSLEAVFAVDEATPYYQVFKHVVKEGETLGGIAELFGVEGDTIVWANGTVINPFNQQVYPGMELEIPEIDGILYTVRVGDTLDSILANSRGGDRFSIIEVNGLIPPHYNIVAGQRLFIPSGELPPPALPGLFPGYFEDPLTHPACAGYKYSRGYIPGFHTGVDLVKSGGCPIRSIAAGEVRFSGWFGSAGHSVIIDHGSGISSYYYHGDGQIWVRPGDFVRKGQDIMYMGNSGNSRGTHLHLTLRRNGANVDPANYVPYSRSRL